MSKTYRITANDDYTCGDAYTLWIDDEYITTGNSPVRLARYVEQLLNRNRV